MQLPIVLLGPFRAGKSTLARLLAARLGLPQVSLDDVRWPYYEEIGYSHRLAQQLRERGGLLALVLYWQLFDAYSVERVLGDYPGAVIDVGAGIGIADSREQFLRVQRALAPHPNVILITPSPDPDEASARCARHGPAGRPELRLPRPLAAPPRLLRSGEAHDLHQEQAAPGVLRRDPADCVVLIASPGA